MPLTEDGPEASDHSRHVLVAQDEELALRPELETEAVDVDHARIVRARQCARDLVVATIALERDTDQIRIVAVARADRPHHLDAAIRRDALGIHEVDDL